jgi:hypothetical protein
MRPAAFEFFFKRPPVGRFLHVEVDPTEPAITAICLIEGWAASAWAKNAGRSAWQDAAIQDLTDRAVSSVGRGPNAPSSSLRASSPGIGGRLIRRCSETAAQR